MTGFDWVDGSPQWTIRVCRNCGEQTDNRDCECLPSDFPDPNEPTTELIDVVSVARLDLMKRICRKVPILQITLKIIC